MHGQPEQKPGVSGPLASTQHGRYKNTSCIEQPAAVDPYNQLTTPLVRAAFSRQAHASGERSGERAYILRVREASRVRWRDHMGWKRDGVLDCLHFCLPSGVMDFWSELLIAKILAPNSDSDMDSEESIAHVRPIE